MGAGANLAGDLRLHELLQQPLPRVPQKRRLVDAGLVSQVHEGDTRFSPQWVPPQRVLVHRQGNPKVVSSSNLRADIYTTTWDSTAILAAAGFTEAIYTQVPRRNTS